MRVIPVLLMAVTIVLIGACGDANSEPTQAELSQCVTTLVYLSYESAPRMSVREALNLHCERFIDSELFAEFYSPLPTRVPLQAPPTGMQPVPPLDGNR
jgi:hypothetical protein